MFVVEYIISQYVVLIKNNKILMLEIAMQNNKGMIISFQIALNFKIGH